MSNRRTPLSLSLFLDGMNAATAPDRPVLFLRHSDGDPIVFYLTSRVSLDWANWIRSRGGSVATKPADAQFVIFPNVDLTPREQLQRDVFKKRDVPTVLEQWLIRMRRFGCITSWTQWACDPVYRAEPLVEDQELADQLRMHGVDNVGDESVDPSEIDRNLSRKFPHHPIEWFREQRLGYRPDNFAPMPIHQVPESPPAAVPSAPYLNHFKQEPTAWYLPTPTSSAQQSQSQSQPQYAEEELDPIYHDPGMELMEELFLTPSSSIFEGANSPTVPPTQDQPLELGSREDGQDREGGVVPGSPEDEGMSGSPIMGMPSPILEQPHSPTCLEQFFRGSGSPVPLFGEGMDLCNHELGGVPSFPPRATTSDADADATEQLLHGIENLSHWEPTPSIHGHSRRDRLPPTFEEPRGLWYNSNTRGDRYQREDNVLYNESDKVQASRVRGDELQYGWELIQAFYQASIWISPAKLGEQINHLFHVHGGRIDWAKYLTEKPNYKKVRGLRREWRETHWRARNPDAEEEPLTHEWFTFGQAVDPTTVRASPPEPSPEPSDDEHDELNIRKSRPKKCVRSTGTDKTAGRRKRKRAAGSRFKTSDSRRDGVLASSSSASSASPSSSISSSRKDDLPNSESSREKVGQGRNKRRRFD